MKLFQTNYSVIILLFAIAFLMINGCKTDDVKPEPQIPPKSSFIMDYEYFLNPTDTVIGKKSTESHQYWGRAFAHVTIWNTLIKVGLVVPVTAFLESFNHEAIYHPDDEYWSWSYNFTAGGSAFLAELNASHSNDSLLWIMKISKGGSYQNFEWFRGKSAIHRGGGWWVLNESPNKPNEILRINWTHNLEGTGTVKYSNIKETSPEYESYIYYGSTTLELNRFYNILSTNHNNLVEIEWNSFDKHGRIGGLVVGFLYRRYPDRACRD